MLNAELTMKTKSLIAYWLVVPLLLAGYIAAMAKEQPIRSKHDGPNEYASPNGHAWGFHKDGPGKPDKTP